MEFPRPSQRESAAVDPSRWVAARIAMLLAIVVCWTALAPHSLAATPGARVVAVVNDEPVTDGDVDQRVRLNKLMQGSRGAASQLRKQALEDLIDDHLKRQEAKRRGVKISDKQVEQTIGRIAASNGGSLAAMKANLRKGGVKFSTLKHQIEAQLSWNAVIRQRLGAAVKIDDQDIERELAQLKKNPGKTRTFMVLQQVVMPLQPGSPRELVYSRVLEAQRLQQGFRGCSTTRKVVEQNAIFNVQVRDIGTVPSDSLPDKLRQVLAKMGPGKMSQPNVTPTGIELIAYCDRKVEKPEPVTREAVQNKLLDERYGLHARSYLRDLRRDSLVEYRE